MGQDARRRAGESGGNALTPKTCFRHVFTKHAHQTCLQNMFTYHVEISYVEILIKSHQIFAFTTPDRVIW